MIAHIVLCPTACSSPANNFFWTVQGRIQGKKVFFKIFFSPANPSSGSQSILTTAESAAFDLSSLRPSPAFPPLPSLAAAAVFITVVKLRHCSEERAKGSSQRTLAKAGGRERGGGHRTGKRGERTGEGGSHLSSFAKHGDFFPPPISPVLFSFPSPVRDPVKKLSRAA